MRIAAWLAARLRRSARVLGALVGVLVLLITLERIGWADVGSGLRHSSPVAIVASTLLGVPITLLRALRTRVLLGRTQPRVPMTLLVSSQLVGQTLSAVTPAATGDLWRAVMWQRAAGIRLRWGFLVIITERVVSLCLLIGCGLVLIAPATGARLTAAAVVAAGAVLTVLPWIAVATLAGQPRLRRAVSALLAATPLRRRLDVVRQPANDMTAVIMAPRVIAWTACTSLAVFVLGGLQIELLVDGLGGHIDLTGATAAACLSQGLSSLSTLPFGIGVGDLSTVGVLSWLGVGAGVGAATAVLVRLTVTLPATAAAAVILMVRPDASPRRMRHGDAATASAIGEPALTGSVGATGGDGAA
jgi:uncharacterized protein (TIRG00374 family)